jgi:hypothetical protein
MWKILEKGAEKKPQDASIMIIDTDFVTRNSLKGAVTKIFG